MKGTGDRMTDLMKETKEASKIIGNYEEMTVAELADGYCDATDAGDELKRNGYMAALMLKYWYIQQKMYQKCKAVTMYSYEDYFDVAYQCIETAMQYRAWRDPAKKTSAEACISSAITARGAAAILYNSNLDKNKANVNMAPSLDSLVDERQSANGEFKLDQLKDETTKEPMSMAEGYIQSFVNKHRVLEAIILDVIAFGDSVKTETVKRKEVDIDSETNEEYTVTDTYVSFWRYKTIQLLANLPKNYGKEFEKKYKVAKKELDDAINTLRNSKNAKLYNFLDNTLAYSKNTSEDFETFCL